MLIFFDFETYSEANLEEIGSVAYARHPTTRPVCMAYAVNGGDVKIWERGQPVPEEFLQYAKSDALFVAHNAIFDRNILQHCAPFASTFANLPIERFLCAQAQCEGSALPGGLGRAAEAMKAPIKKNADGKKLMKLFCMPSETAGTPDEWVRFVQYCKDDVAAMREVWLRCRPLTKGEWAEYHASERINDAGLLVNTTFAARATEIADVCAERARGRIVELTGDDGMTAKTYVRHQNWLRERLSPEQLALITDEEGKLSVDKDSRRKLLDCDGLNQTAADFVQALDEAGGAAASKFKRMTQMAGADGRVRGCYVFNGGRQTGRFSSRGIQMHNIIRAPLKEGEPNAARDAIDIAISNPPARAVELLEAKFQMPAPDILARLIRPTIIAPPGCALIWGDYSQIEARVLPWLSDSRGGGSKLDLFRKGKDPYTHAYADMYGIAVEDVTKDQRKIGKVVELALGYQGGWRALKKMARNYQLDFDEKQARELVERWRAANRWAVQFWGEINDAAKECLDSPGVRVKVGRLTYSYQPKLLGGALVCVLPSGRPLVYPKTRFDIKEDELGRRYRDVVYMKYDGRQAYRNGFYGGLGAENATQGASACMLRAKLAELVQAGVKVVGSTHDEAMLEVPETLVDDAVAKLKTRMETNPEWAAGLPLKVEVEHGPFWTK